MNRFLLLILTAAAFSSCTTIENRRDLYSQEKVEGPYTRMLAKRKWNSPDAPQKSIPPQTPATPDGKTVKPVL